MLQGTGSDVGKSVLVAGLCRAAHRRGIDVAPFKPQNMSNNAAVCPGGEIGRAQALQARAAGIEPSVDHNPVLLKPESDRAAQVIVHGHVHSRLDAGDFIAGRGSLLPQVMASFERLRARHDLILVEGAGSPAETNLRQGDIANMGFARRGDVPVVLIADIERGGVIANLVGTHAVLYREDRDMIRGFIVNKFRGERRLFDAGLADIERRTGWPSFGVVPWLPACASLPAEDAVSFAAPNGSCGDRPIRVAAPMLSRMANFDDADPLRMEPAVDFHFVPPGRPLPRDLDLVILFGSKSTCADLAFLRAQGWDHDIIAHARAGGRVLGICGGYQMLGRCIVDEAGAEGTAGTVDGLGLLDVTTTLHTDKCVRRVEGHCATSGSPLHGYEIHVGRTSGADCSRPLLQIGTRPEGARSPGGRIEGTYVHGLFGGDEYRAAWLRAFDSADSEFRYEPSVEGALDALAEGLEEALDIDGLFKASRVSS
jgi:adenosylcobyric acid synthase